MTNARGHLPITTSPDGPDIIDNCLTSPRDIEALREIDWDKEEAGDIAAPQVGARREDRCRSLVADYHNGLDEDFLSASARSHSGRTRRSCKATSGLRTRG